MESFVKRKVWSCKGLRLGHLKFEGGGKRPWESRRRGPGLCADIGVRQSEGGQALHVALW